MVQWDLAEECLLKAGDLNGLLLLYTSIARGEGIEKLAQLAVEQGKNNIAFMCYFQLRRVDACIDLLCDTGRIPEAAFFARTYAPGYHTRQPLPLHWNLKNSHVCRVCSCAVSFDSVKSRAW
jgi:coatomer subunit beta'